MNISMLSPSERMSEWRSFRKSLVSMPEMDQLKAVAEWWGSWPVETYTIDWDQPDSWPTPWELIHEGGLCKTAIAYLMEQTLVLAGWSPERLKLIFVRDLEREDQMMLLLVDDTLALNYSLGDVFNFDKALPHCAILCQYRAVEGGHIEV